jgi:hypothetical protein
MSRDLLFLRTVCIKCQSGFFKFVFIYTEKEVVHRLSASVREALFGPGRPTWVAPF